MSGLPTRIAGHDISMNWGIVKPRVTQISRQVAGGSAQLPRCSR